MLLPFGPDTVNNEFLISFQLLKPGGERGIRTLDTPFGVYMISNHALSATQTPLQICYYSDFSATAGSAAGAWASFFSTVASAAATGRSVRAGAACAGRCPAGRGPWP